MVQPENERRFLLNGFPMINNRVRGTNIKQGYIELPSSLDSFRSRILGGKVAVLTLKEGKGVTRIENEERVSIELGRAIIEKSHHKITKFRITYQGWEIDIFGGVLAGIILAEKEFKDAEESFTIPAWLEPVVVREVTDSLSNLHLARLASDLEGTDSPALIHLQNQSVKIKKAVLTGGPCSGKSTIMGLLKNEYPNVHFVPEVATIIISQLGIIPGKDTLGLKRFQETVYRTQTLFEATSVQFAASQGKNAVVLDRGKADGAVYMPGGIKQFERTFNTTISDIYALYDAVVFLEVPSEDIYESKKVNNPARLETYEEARKLGAKVAGVWSGHPSFYTTSAVQWDDKVEEVKSFLRKHNIV